MELSHYFNSHIIQTQSLFLFLSSVSIMLIGLGQHTKFCFEAEAWHELLGHEDGMVVLDKVFRQKDSVFLTMLNEMRRGIVSDATNAILTEKVRESNRPKCSGTSTTRYGITGSGAGTGTGTSSIKGSAQRDRYGKTDGREGSKDMGGREESPTDGSVGSDETIDIEPTKLFAVNTKVDAYNLRMLEQLGGECDREVYIAVDTGRDPYLQQLRNGTKIPERLELKIGAQVDIIDKTYHFT